MAGGLLLVTFSAVSVLFLTATVTSRFSLLDSNVTQTAAATAVSVPGTSNRMTAITTTATATATAAAATTTASASIATTPMSSLSSDRADPSRPHLIFSQTNDDKDRQGSSSSISSSSSSRSQTSTHSSSSLSSSTSSSISSSSTTTSKKSSPSLSSSSSRHNSSSSSSSFSLNQPKKETQTSTKTKTKTKHRHQKDEGAKLNKRSSAKTTTTKSTTASDDDDDDTTVSKELSSTDRRKLQFPPLETLLKPKFIAKMKDKNDDKDDGDDSSNIIGDVRFLLDFAILGHAKCATSYIMKYLHAHERVQIWDYEVCDLYDHRPARLVHKLYTELGNSNQSNNNKLLWRGFKCPGHFSRQAMRYFRRYFERTKLIVGLRHPVWWFESYYNFRYRHLTARPKASSSGKGIITLPNATDLASLDACPPEALGVCVKFAQYHHHLAMFGRTNLTHDDHEWKLLSGLHGKYRLLSPIGNPIFLYDMQQLYDTNVQRQALFRKDLQEFLGLPTPLPSPDDYNDTDTSGHKSAVRKETRINICDNEFIPLRQALLQVGRQASDWMLDYFLQAPRVYVSHRPMFEAAVREWKMDPCVEGQRTKIGAGNAATSLE